MSPKEDAFITVHMRLHNLLGRMEDAFYFKTSNLSIMLDLYHDREGLMPWWWPIIVGW